MTGLFSNPGVSGAGPPARPKVWASLTLTPNSFSSPFSSPLALRLASLRAHVIAMKIFGVIALVIALAFAAEAYTPYNYAISASGNCTSGYVKVCNGNTVCPSYNSMGCCGGCSSSYCGLCGSGYTCISGSCAWIYSIGMYSLLRRLFFSNPSFPVHMLTILSFPSEFAVIGCVIGGICAFL